MLEEGGSVVVRHVGWVGVVPCTMKIVVGWLHNFSVVAKLSRLEMSTENTKLLKSAITSLN